MYLGKIVEMASCQELFENTRHPYTEALISSVPLPNPTLNRQRIILSGDPPSPIDLPSGCRFSSRCPYVMKKCLESEPLLEDIGQNHKVACFKGAG
jgi:oligopeptide/dipeptide ABC transporter ATP-binding protein